MTNKKTTEVMKTKTKTNIRKENRVVMVLSFPSRTPRGIGRYVTEAMVAGTVGIGILWLWVDSIPKDQWALTVSAVFVAFLISREIAIHMFLVGIGAVLQVLKIAVRKLERASGEPLPTPDQDSTMRVFKILLVYVIVALGFFEIGSSIIFSNLYLSTQDGLVQLPSTVTNLAYGFYVGGLVMVLGLLIMGFCLAFVGLAQADAMERMNRVQQFGANIRAVHKKGRSADPVTQLVLGAA